MNSPRPIFPRVLTLLADALGNARHDYTRGSLRRAVFLLAIPMVLEMSMASLFAVVDIFFVARLGAAAVAVVGLTEALLVLVYAVALGISMSATAVVARRIGENREDEAAHAAIQVCWIGLFVSLPIMILGFVFGSSILGLMGADAATQQLGNLFVVIMLSGSASIVFLFLFNAIFRGAGDPGVAMRSLWLSNGINIILDPCLIFGLGVFPELGVTGAAVASVIGRCVGVGYQIRQLTGGRRRLQPGLRHLRPDFAQILNLARISVGGILQFLVATSSWLIIIRMVASFGNTAVAGYTVALRILEFTILPAWGMCNAASTLVGQHLGASNIPRAERAVWHVVRYNFAFMFSAGVIFVVWAEVIAGWLATDPETLFYAALCLRWFAYGYGFYAVGMVLVHAFNGAGDTLTPTVINLGCYWIVQLPLAALLAFYYGLESEGVFIAMFVAESLLALVGFLVFRTGRWQLAKA